MRTMDGEAWRALGDGTDAGAAAALVTEREARVVAVTGGVAAGKSTFSAAVADALGGDAVVVATDGFLLPTALLAERGLAERKGFPESYDRDALDSFLAAVARGERAAAPVYSHRTYDVVPGEEVVVDGADVVLVEGLHLGGDELGVRDRFDLIVHLDAADDDLRAWYLERFRALRAAAADDPTAFLHPYLEAMGPEALDAVALDVWRAVNLAVLAEHVRPAAEHADVVLHLDAAHRVETAVLRLA